MSTNFDFNTLLSPHDFELFCKDLFSDYLGVELKSYREGQDEGIDLKGFTDDEIVAMIIEGIKSDNQADAICKAVDEMGRILKEHFPIKADDTNELRNLIVEGD